MNHKKKPHSEELACKKRYRAPSLIKLNDCLFFLLKITTSAHEEEFSCI